MKYSKCAFSYSKNKSTGDKILLAKWGVQTMKSENLYLLSKIL